MTAPDFEQMIRDVEPSLPEGTIARLAEAVRVGYDAGTRDGLLLAASQVRDRSERAALRALSVGETGLRRGRGRRDAPRPPF